MKISFNSTNDEKSDYLKNVVFERIETLQSGRLTIKTIYLEKVAQMLGGSYKQMNKVQKFIFKSDLMDERIWADTDIMKYLK